MNNTVLAIGVASGAFIVLMLTIITVVCLKYKSDEDEDIEQRCQDYEKRNNRTGSYQE